MFDVAHHLGAVLRTVSSLEVDGKPGRTVSLERGYATTSEALWQALTNPERLSRWFLPVTGDLSLRGRYQLEGNAGGEILACTTAEHLSLTWEFGGDKSWVDLRLTPGEAAQTRLKLTHTAHLSEHWGQYGPSATGIGWELSLLALALHLMEPEAPKFDEAAFAASEVGKAIITGSGEGWAQAEIELGEDPQTALTKARRTVSFYTGNPTDES